MISHGFKLVFFLASLLLVPSCYSAPNWYQKTFYVMGTEAKVEFQSGSKSLADKLISDVITEMDRIDHLMSPFKPESELSKLNQSGFNNAFAVSAEMYRLLELSIHYSKLTNGAFDVTFSSLGYLYDFKKKLKPTQIEIDRLTSSIDYQSIILLPETSSIKFKNKNTRIDLGGIAKGHAVDQCIKLLEAAGIKNAFVSAGGDSRVIGKKNDRLWYIGIRDPRDSKKLIVNLPLEEVSISTSGDYERFFIKNNVRYHHILDPKTGDSARDSQSVTILASNSTEADALSTSVFVLGPKKGLALINSIPDISAVIIDKHGKMSFSDDLVPAK
ncbi:MAG: FAD:protein FMN transferase [Kangiellaceae bacterium]|nr:FAD:protein FMN transferase [Kangiellaceae bacterium]